MFIYSKNTVYNTRTFLYNYNGYDYRLVTIKSCRLPGFIELNSSKNRSFIDYNSDEVKRCSLSRTRRNIRELCLCNDFTYFVTLTINSNNSDRYSLDECQSKLKKTLKKIKRKSSDFRYILITERHKDGAFHFHGLMSNLPSTDIYKNCYGYFSSHIFDFELGFNSFSFIRNYSATCNYILKYITKDCVRNSSGSVYISSRGLKKALKEEIKPFDFKPTFYNDFVKIRDFNFDKLSNLDKINFLKILNN